MVNSLVAYFVGNGKHSIWLNDIGDCPDLEVQLRGANFILLPGVPKSLSSA